MFDIKKKKCEICLKETRTKYFVCKSCLHEISKSAFAQWIDDAPTSDNPLVNYTARLALEARYGNNDNDHDHDRR